MPYNHLEIEKKMQAFWRNSDVYKTESFSNKPKIYILDMFPYPSGAGLHVGHPRGYVGSDILARFYRQSGYNVLHPMGFDSFGLPAENYAKKNKVMPSIVTKQNIDTYKRQLSSLGFSYDWSREVVTSDEKYFKWTQWIFLELFKNGLAFEESTMVNWCPALGTILANEEVVDGLSDIGSHPVYRKPLKQWSLAITKYAERLNADIVTLDKWPSKIKVMQENWIGRSEGYEVKFPLVDSDKFIEVYTTRIDTIPSNTFLIIAPEHPMVESITTKDNQEAVSNYIKETSLKSDLTRQENQDFTGVFTGSYATNPINGKQLPIWIADFVLAHYAKGAVFGDAHDERDFALAKKYNIPLDTNIFPIDANQETIDSIKNLEVCFADLGEDESGQKSEDLKKQYGSILEQKSLAIKKINYRLKDWGFSRQRYWGEPIPILYEVDSAKKRISGPKPLALELLPLSLPAISNFELIDYDTTKEDPEPILNRFEDWLYVQGYYNTKGEVVTVSSSDSIPEGADLKNFVREGNTMPQWAGSSWYYLRFMDPHNTNEFVDPAIEKYWGQVDIYIGGAEHAVLHLLYARFWHKVLFDLGHVTTIEPFKELMNQGLIMAEDGRKMSKSLGNVINPDDIIKELGADALRIFEMFIGPFDQNVAWSTSGIIGMRRFLDKIDSISAKVINDHNSNLDFIQNVTIKEVTSNLKEYKFNSAIARMMEWANIVIKEVSLSKNQYTDFLKILAPFAPHLTEKLWLDLGNSESIHISKWPTYDEEKTKQTIKLIGVQVNGKLRGEIEVTEDDNEETVIQKAKAIENISKNIQEPFKKVVYIPMRILNIIC
ncbi:MAG: leucine--tRNA ligase [Patescibacteria group bacterium]